MFQVLHKIQTSSGVYDMTDSLNSVCVNIQLLDSEISAGCLFVNLCSNGCLILNHVLNGYLLVNLCNE